jgi:hypothetical protein
MAGAEPDSEGSLTSDKLLALLGKAFTLLAAVLPRAHRVCRSYLSDKPLQQDIEKGIQTPPRSANPSIKETPFDSNSTLSRERPSQSDLGEFKVEDIWAQLESKLKSKREMEQKRPRLEREAGMRQRVFCFDCKLFTGRRKGQCLRCGRVACDHNFVI